MKRATASRAGRMRTDEEMAEQRAKDAARKASYRARNPEKARAAAARDYAAIKVSPERAAKARAKDIGRKAVYRSRYPERAKAQNAAAIAKDRSDPAQFLWRSAKRRAAANGVPFSIVPEDIHVPAHCPALGVPMAFHCGRESSPSLDRVNNAAGYAPGNVHVISYRANRLKSDATLDELRRLVAYIETSLT